MNASADDSSLPPVRMSAPAMVLAHGGVGTLPSQSERVARAARAAWASLELGRPVLDSAVSGTVVLENDPGFNAGTGSNIRMDGETVQMDAAVMDELGDFGAVAVIERVKNPVLVAREVLRSPHMLIAGAGATRFARTLGFPDYDPRTPESIERYQQLRYRMDEGLLGDGWEKFDWRHRWNFPSKLPAELIPHDTVGVIVTDGLGHFASAVSTGGTTTTLSGRVGDVPIPGAGTYAGPYGAVCATGWGEFLIRESISRRVYEWMAEGDTPDAAVQKGLALVPDEIGVGLLALSSKGYAVATNSTMAWAGIVKGKTLSADHDGDTPQSIRPN